MRVTVFAVSIPAMSTIGYGRGFNDQGNVVDFLGDHRPMYHLGKAVAQARNDELPVVKLARWQIVRRVAPRGGDQTRNVVMDLESRITRESSPRSQNRTPGRFGPGQRVLDKAGFSEVPED